MNQHTIITKGISLSRLLLASGGSTRKKLLEKLKDQEVVLAGDGRHDSMGHLA